MPTISSNIPTSLGDIITIKAHLDAVKHNYQQINLTFHTALWPGALHTESPQWGHNKILWNKYLNDIGQLFFSQPPYKVNVGQFPFRITEHLIRDFNLPPVKPDLGHLLCKGTPLSLDKEYIVITTKVRDIIKRNFLPQSIQLWEMLKKLSHKYKIVILGERIVEMRKEYDPLKDRIFGIYEQIITNIASENILDLTVPALGETVSDLSKIQQDCLIMKNAKFVITLGNGGNFCLSSAVSNMTVSYRIDSLWLTDRIFNKEYSNIITTKDWKYFIKTLEKYL
jgi:hypothetical protein